MANLGSSDTPIVGQSVETEQSPTVSGDDTITLGRNHGATVQGANVAIGVGAQALEDVDGTVSGNDPRRVAVGYQAAQNNEQYADTAVGYQALEGSTAFSSTAVGYGAGQNSSGDRSSAVGRGAGRSNSGSQLTAVGISAGQGNSGSRVVAIGRLSGDENTGDRSVFVGALSGWSGSLSDPSTMGDRNVGVGNQALRGNQASGIIALGYEAGRGVQTDDQLIITQRDGTRRMVMDLTTGDLNITGQLTENATL